MLEAFSIFHVSGPVLWSRGASGATERAINALINDVFIEEKVRSSYFQHDKFTLKWTRVAEFGLCFVAVYQSLLHLSWVDQFLEDIRVVFVKTNRPQLEAGNWIAKYKNFDGYYDKILLRYKQEQEESLEASRAAPRAEDSVAEKSVKQEEKDNGGPPPPLPNPYLRAQSQTGPSDGSQNTTPVQSPDVSRPTTPLPGAAHLLAENRPASRGSRRARKAANAANNAARSGTNSAYVSSGDEAKRPKTPKSGKKGRVWDADGIAVEEDDTVLDYSNMADSPVANTTAPESIEQSTWGIRNQKGQFVLKDLDNEINNILNESEDEPVTDAPSSGAFGKLSGYFRNIVGGKTLTEQDLEQPIRAMEEHLIKKNVAREAAIQLCDGIKAEMVGKKTGSFESTEKSIRPALEKSLRRLLTPRTSLDLLQEIDSVVKAGRRPYVISVVGVNGVGKSTNLSKICYFLLQNNYKVLVVAGDTFRAGAVEQLGVHVRNLKELSAREQVGKVDLFQKGYGKDAANIAKDAVAFATTNDFNVVLIDTAGRAHNNQQLMSALEKFGDYANPDKIFQVAEALVGNDSVNQARNFNKAFGKNRSMNGFIISKCDTVGDQIGTIVSMVAATGIPVVFLGVGQHYGDLRQLSIPWAVNHLMS